MKTNHRVAGIWLALLLPTSPRAAPCDEAVRDGHVVLEGLAHDSFDLAYRAPFGAVPAGTTTTLRLRACANDISRARLRVWDDREDTETWLDMAVADSAQDPTLGPVAYWQVELVAPVAPTLLYYLFQVDDGAASAWYLDDEVQRWGGGPGEASLLLDDQRSYQVSVYDPALAPPAWWQGALVYQVFPDRFRNGDVLNDPVTGQGWIYGYTPTMLAWTDTLQGDCLAGDMSQGVCFYGGDLLGITSQIDGLAALGVEALYLNPIFLSGTNHRYEPQDYFTIDPELGGDAAFQALLDSAAAHGMRLMLDGVFNHLSSDSPQFDAYNRWDTNGALTSPDGPGTNDGSGACESADSPWRSLFYIPAVGSPARYDDGRLALCPYGASPADGETYQGWAGFYHIPKLRADDPLMRALIYSDGIHSAGPYWVSRGIGGWRLDVPDEVDPGVGAAPDNPFWEEFRAALHAVDPDAAVLGENWGDASGNLVDGSWDSFSNYRFRAAVLDWMFDGCSGDGCVPCSERNCQGQAFQDSQSNPHRDSGEINAISESLLWLRLQAVLEDLPSPLWTSALNLLGSHDVNRVLWLLEKISTDDAALAKEKLSFLATFQYTWPGCPHIYYGDEVALAAPGGWEDGAWQADPYNRAPYPWADQGLSPGTTLLAHYQALGALHRQLPALKTGDLQMLLVDDAARVFAFARHGAGLDPVVVVMNRRWLGAAGSQVVSVPLAGLVADGSVLVDALGGTCATVREGALRAPVADLSGSVWALSTAACAVDSGGADSGGAQDSGVPDSGAVGSGTSDSGGKSGGCGCGGRGTGGTGGRGIGGAWLAAGWGALLGAWRARGRPPMSHNPG